MATAQVKDQQRSTATSDISQSISHMDPEFLYLAASQAIASGNPLLAISFLKALSEKDAQAVLPRLQLAELLLQSGRIGEARKYIKALLAMPDVGLKYRNKIQLLDVRILVIDGKQDKAINKLQKMLQAMPAAYPLRLMLVRLLTRESRFAEAHRSIQDGLKLRLHPQLYHIDAQLYIQQGKLDKAEKSLKTLMKIEPDAVGPVLMYSQLVLRQKKPVKAENILRHFLVRHPEALSVSNALGRLLVDQARSQEAIRVYEDIAERSGGNPDVLIALGLLHFQQQSFAKAAASFRKALKQRKNTRATFYLAASLESLGNKDQARKLYASLEKNDENFIAAQLRIAALDLLADRNDKAIRALHNIIRSKPDAGQAYALLSAALMRKKAFKQLIEETEPALALSKVPGQLLFNRAAAFEGLKQFSRAAGQIKQLFSIDPNNIEALNFLGYLYAEQGIRLDEAEKLIRRALDKRPDNGYYLDSLAWVHYKRTEYAKALLVQRKAVDIVPDDSIMHEHLGDILWKNGKTDEARSAWKKAVQLGHDSSRRMQQKIKQGM
ncbi:MAG: tetratricopeptide repeat protein [Mariprofundaceae bacterium]|nr:tetratricopeptide repeat protein [Mariprofundaceae bacterium]